MNRFEFMLNLDNYRNAKPKSVLQHDSYDIPKQKIHQIQSDYSRAPKTYKDQISLYEEYNEDTLSHASNYKYYQKIDLGNGNVRYFYTKEEWDAYQNGGESSNKSNDRSGSPYYMKEANGYGPGKTRYFYNKQEWNAHQRDKASKQSEEDRKDNIRSDKAVQIYTDLAKTDPKKAARQMYENRDFGLDELFYEVKEAIKDGSMIWDGSDLAAVSGSESDKQKYNEANEHVLEIYRDMQKYIDAIAEDSEAGAKLWKEFRTLMTNKFARLSKKYAPK